MELADNGDSTDDWLIPDDRAGQAAEPAAKRTEERLEEALAMAREAVRIAIGADHLARKADEAGKARVGRLTDRVESGLARIEARERALIEARQRALVRPAPEARREELTLLSFDERADRIVQRLKVLESSRAVVRVKGPASQTR